jgi:hypothetical protein
LRVGIAHRPATDQGSIDGLPTIAVMAISRRGIDAISTEPYTCFSIPLSMAAHRGALGPLVARSLLLAF